MQFAGGGSLVARSLGQELVIFLGSVKLVEVI